MIQKNSIRPLAAQAAQATSPPLGVASRGDATVAYTSTVSMGPGVVVVRCNLTMHCQLARAQKGSHSNV